MPSSKGKWKRKSGEMADLIGPSPDVMHQVLELVTLEYKLFLFKSSTTFFLLYEVDYSPSTFLVQDGAVIFKLSTYVDLSKGPAENSPGLTF